MAEKRGALPNKQLFNDRTQMGAFEWQGMAPDVEPQDLPANRPSMLRNVRLMGGGIAARPGMTAGISLGAEVTGMTDFQLGTGGASGGPSLVMLSGSVASTPSTVGNYDTEQSPVLQRIIDYSNLGLPLGGFPVAILGDTLYFAVPRDGSTPSALMKLTPARVQYGQNINTFSSGRQSVKVWDLPSPYTQISALQEFNGDLYIAVNDAGANGAVFQFDGTTITFETSWVDAFGAMIGSMCVFRETLVACTLTSPRSSDVIKVRTTAGVWSDIAPASGSVGCNGVGKIVSYKDRLYFSNNDAGGFGAMHSFDGTTLSLIAAATSGVPANGTVHSVAVYEGYLYYVYSGPALGDSPRIGRFDGTTWTPNYKGIGAQFAADDVTEVGLCDYRGNLICAYTKTGVTYLVQSPGTNVSGTWTATSFGATPVSGAGQFLAY